jgi:hypothetical protein
MVAPQFNILYNPLLPELVYTKPVIVLTTLLDILPNFVADCALICRMLAVYSSPLTSKPRYYVILGTTITIKMMRVVCIIIFLFYIGRGPVSSVTYQWNSQQRIWTIVDRCVTAIDNVYVH